MQSELASLNQIYQDRSLEWLLTDRARDRETANFVQFQRVIFIFDNIGESTNRHLDNLQLTLVMFCIVLQIDATADRVHCHTRREKRTRDPMGVLIKTVAGNNFNPHLR